MTVAATEEFICCVDVFRKQTFCYLWLSEYENDDFEPLNSNRESATQNRIKNAPNTYFMCNYFMLLLYSVCLFALCDYLQTNDATTNDHGDGSNAAEHIKIMNQTQWQLYFTRGPNKPTYRWQPLHKAHINPNNMH